MATTAASRLTTSASRRRAKIYQAAPLSCDHLLGQDHEEFKRRLLDFSLAHEQDPCPVNPDFPEHREFLRSFGVTTLGQHIEFLTPEYESVTVWRDAVRADHAWGDAAVIACAALFLHSRIDVLVRNSVEQWSVGLSLAPASSSPNVEMCVLHVFGKVGPAYFGHSLACNCS